MHQGLVARHAQAEVVVEHHLGFENEGMVIRTAEPQKAVPEILEGKIQRCADLRPQLPVEAVTERLESGKDGDALVAQKAAHPPVEDGCVPHEGGRIGNGNLSV